MKNQLRKTIDEDFAERGLEIRHDAQRYGWGMFVIDPTKAQPLFIRDAQWHHDNNLPIVNRSLTLKGVVTELFFGKREEPEWWRHRPDSLYMPAMHG